MPTLEFADEQENVFEVFFNSHTEFPCGIGDWTEIGEGVSKIRVRRLPPSVQKPLEQEECHHVSRVHPPFWRFHREQGGKFDSKGRSIFNSWDQVKRSVKHANSKGENVVYDGPAGIGEIR